MTFVNKIFERATIRGITDYLLFNESPLVEKKADYKTRLDEAYQSCQSVLLLYDEDQESALFRSVDELLNETELVYMEIGLQAGFLLTNDIMKQTDSFEKNVDGEAENLMADKMEEFLDTYFEAEAKSDNPHFKMVLKQLGIDISDFSGEEANVLEKCLSRADFAKTAALNSRSLKHYKKRQPMK